MGLIINYQMLFSNFSQTGVLNMKDKLLLLGKALILFFPILLITSAPSLVGEWSNDITLNAVYVGVTSVISILILSLMCIKLKVLGMRIKFADWQGQVRDAVVLALATLLLLNILATVLSPIEDDSAVGVLHGQLKYPIMIALCLTGPITEELTFRGIYESVLNRLIAKKIAPIIIAMLFSLAHGVEVERIITFFVFSLGCSWLNRRYRDIKTSILSHLIYNTIVTVIVLIQ